MDMDCYFFLHHANPRPRFYFIFPSTQQGFSNMKEKSKLAPVHQTAANISVMRVQWLKSQYYPREASFWASFATVEPLIMHTSENA